MLRRTYVLVQLHTKPTFDNEVEVSANQRREVPVRLGLGERLTRHGVLVKKCLQALTYGA